MNYQAAIKNAEHLKAIGHTEVYLQKDEGEFPWHLAVSCAGGGSHRLDMSTDVAFYGKDPATGICFRWHFEIEPRSASGKGHYEIDVAGCRAVMAKLPEECRTRFAEYLLGCAVKVEEMGKEWEAITSRQFADAAALRRIVNGGGK